MSIEMNVSDKMMNVLSKLFLEGYNEGVAAICREHGLELPRSEPKVVLKTSKKVKEAKAKVEKASIPLPFISCNESLCRGVKANHCLYTQCQQKPMKGGSFCKTCTKQCEKNANGKPDCGSMEERVNAEYCGPKGDKPKAYALVMKKLKLTREQVEAEANKVGIVVDEEHFAEPIGEKKRGRPSKKSESETGSETKKRGRPKKAVKEVQEEQVEDLLSAANLIEDNDDISEITSNSADDMTIEEKPVAKETANGKKEAKEAEKAAKEAEKAAKKEAAEAEKAAKKEAKEAEKAAKKEAAEAKKKPAKKEEVPAPVEVVAPVEVPAPVEVAAPVEKDAPVKMKVKKFEYKGSKYFRTSNNVVYDMDKDEVGVWNEETEEIEFSLGTEEEEEEEYEEEE
jgi:AT hook motif